MIKWLTWSCSSVTMIDYLTAYCYPKKDQNSKLWIEGEVQRQSTSLACTQPWVQTPVSMWACVYTHTHAHKCTQNSKLEFGFYGMHITFTQLSSQKILSCIVINQQPCAFIMFLFHHFFCCGVYFLFVGLFILIKEGQDINSLFFATTIS